MTDGGPSDGREESVMSPARAQARVMSDRADLPPDAGLQGAPSGGPAAPGEEGLGEAGMGPHGLNLLVLSIMALLVLVGVAFTPQLFGDGDTFWHLAAGRWMIDHRAILHADPFSYTAPGHAWDTHEWLTEVLMAGVYRALGWSGLQLLFAPAAAALAVIMGVELSRKLNFVGWASMLLFAMYCTVQSWWARPHLLALPLLALWTVQVLRAREERRTPALWLLPLMTLWANLHGSFLIGLGLLAPFALEAVVDAGKDWFRVGRDWALFMLGAVAAAMITPHGLNGLIYPIQIQSMKTLQNIAEWRSADFGQIRPFELALMGGLYVMLSRGVRIPMIRLFTVLGLTHLALHEIRHQMVFAVIVPLLLADPIARALREDGRKPFAPRIPPRVVRGGVAAVAVAAVAVFAVRIAVPPARTDGPNSPGAALAHVPAELRAKHVLNEYGMGGYLIFEGVKPFIDGRADMYGDAFFDAYAKAVKPDRLRMMALLKKYDVSWTILDATNPGVQILDGLPGWKRLYTDKFAVVHVRSGA
jgi:hypothetical protein